MSKTLLELDEDRRPKQHTICMTCIHSVWFHSKDVLQCYCRVMFLTTWHSGKTQEIEGCDGQYLGQDQ